MMILQEQTTRTTIDRIVVSKGKKEKWLNSSQLHDKYKYCPWCKEAKPAADFWDGKKRTARQVCYVCLSHRRDKVKGKINYNSYMKSSAWKSKRKQYWESTEGLKSCYVCSDPWIDFAGKDLHHRTYDRLGNENLDDLVPVCPLCHGRITSAWNEEKKKKSKDRKTLWEVTDLIKNDTSSDWYILIQS